MQMFSVSSNLINLFLRQSKNVNQSSATATNIGRDIGDQHSYNALENILHILKLQFPPFTFWFQTNTSYRHNLPNVNQKSWEMSRDS